MSVNKVILVGRLGKDPETRYMPNGEAVTNATLATSENWKDKSGVKQEKTEWHNLVFYRRLAEVAGEYLKKGSMIYVEGKLQTRKWQDKEGKDRYTTDIIVGEMTIWAANRPAAASKWSKINSIPPSAVSASNVPRLLQDQPPAAAPSSSQGRSFDNFDDDIPSD